MKLRFVSFVILSFVLYTTTLLAASSPKTYSGACGDNITWSLNTGDSILHLVGSGEMTRYAKEKDVPWDSLRQYIAHADFDTTITYIDKYTICSCPNLTELSFADHLTETPVLNGCPKLRTLHMSKSFREIPYGCFMGDTSLDSLYLYDSIQTIGKESLYQLKLRYISWGASVKKVGANIALNGLIEKLDYRGSITDWCNITFEGHHTFTSGTLLYIDGEVADSIYIPDEVTEIKHFCFANYTRMRYCSYKEGTKISETAFEECFIKIWERRAGKEPVIGEEKHQITKDLQFYYNRQGKYVSFSGTGDMIDCKFNSDYVIDSIFIPNGMTSICNNAFAYHQELKHIVWNYSINTIGDSAFVSCTGLSDTLTIPISANTVYPYAFSGCDSIPVLQYYRFLEYDDIAFPWHAKRVQLDTFQGDWYGVQYTLPLQDSTLILEGNTSIYSYRVTYPWAYVKPKVKHLKYLGGITNTGAQIMYDNPNLKDVWMCDSIKTVDNTSFMFCTALDSVKFSNTLKSIGSNAFWGDKSLELIKLPESVESIGGMAFYVCSNLENLELPKMLRTISNDAFSGCTKFKGELYLPDSVQTIGLRCFANSGSGITSVRLPKSIQVIEDRAFLLNGLTTFRYAGTVEDWLKVKLYGMSANPSHKAQQILFEGNRAVREINFSDTVQSIGQYQFYNDTLLKEISYYRHTEVHPTAFEGTGANITIKDLDRHTTDATLHGQLITKKGEKLIRATLKIKQKKSRKTITITTDKTGKYLLNWENGTYTAIGGTTGPHRMIMDDEIGTLVVIIVDSKTNNATGETTYNFNIEVSNLPSEGQYPYSLNATTEYLEEVTEQFTNKHGETIEKHHLLGEQNNYLVLEGIINTDDDASIGYWGGDKFFVPTENTDVYDFTGRYIGKWSVNLPRGIYIIKEGEQCCQWGH